MSLNFTKTEIPATSRVGRKPLDNPFTDLFPLDGEAVKFVIAEAPDSTEAKRIVRQVRQAAKAVDRSGRTDMKVSDKGTEVTVWTVPAITREAKAVKAEPAKAEAKAKAPAKGAKVEPNPKEDRKPVAK